MVSMSPQNRRSMEDENEESKRSRQNVGTSRFSTYSAIDAFLLALRILMYYYILCKVEYSISSTCLPFGLKEATPIVWRHGLLDVRPGQTAAVTSHQNAGGSKIDKVDAHQNTNRIPLCQGHAKNNKQAHKKRQETRHVCNETSSHSTIHPGH